MEGRSSYSSIRLTISYKFRNRNIHISSKSRLRVTEEIEIENKMSKIIYYIGAGASYGKRQIISKEKSDEEVILTEGLPVVAEIPNRIRKFRKFINDCVISHDLYYEFKGMFNTRGSDIERQRLDMLQDIDELIEGIVNHATIDTYAKKLFLIRDLRRFKTLKNVLCAYFVWEQLDHAVDQRYDIFLASVLSMANLYLPKDISVVSWNYDSQFELAYNFYTRNGKFPVFDKNNDNEWEVLPNYGCVFKVNGSATYGNFSVVNEILKDDKLPKDIQLIIFYGDSKADTSQMGFQFTPHLSFAWEQTPNQSKMMEYIKQASQDTISLVVIGYSFPFFNRDVDRSIIANMPQLKTIYIQDPNAESIEQSLRAVLPDGVSIKIEHRKNCDQFYLPSEL